MDSGHSPQTVSVVIPCFNAEETLTPVLNALLTADPPPHEILVIDDASFDQSREIISAAQVPMVELGIHQGVAAARNLGAEESTGDIVCFVDADVVVPHNFISHILNHFGTHPECVALSATINPDSPRGGFLSEYLNLRLHHGFSHLGREVTTLCTSCAAIKKEAFSLVSGFDRSATCAVNDEAVLGWRLAEKGLRTCFPPSFSVIHLKTMQLGDWGRKFWKEGQQWVLIVDRHNRTSETSVRRTLHYRRPANVLALILFLVSMLAASLSIFSLPTLFLIFGVAFVSINWAYIHFMVKSRNLFWLPGVTAMILLETILHTMGMFSGLVVAVRR